MINKKVRRHSGRYSANYTNKLPFKVREELDLFDERPLYDDWQNYRDGFRAPMERNKIKFLKSRGKFIPDSFYSC